MNAYFVPQVRGLHGLEADEKQYICVYSKGS
jgi:hypothetical protein